MNFHDPLLGLMLMCAALPLVSDKGPNPRRSAPTFPLASLQPSLALHPVAAPLNC